MVSVHAYLKNSWLIIWRNPVLRWSAIVLFLLVQLYSGIMTFVNYSDFLAAVLSIQWVSILVLIFFLFWGYELFRMAATVNLDEVFGGIKWARLKVFTGEFSLTAVFLIVITVCVFLWNLFSYLISGAESPAALGNALIAGVLNIFLPGLIAVEMGFIFARRFERLTAYSLSILLVFLNSPILSLVRNALTGIPDQIETALNRILDVFVIVPQNLTMYPNSMYGIPIEPYRWQLAFAWIFFLLCIVVLTVPTRRNSIKWISGICLAMICVSMGAVSIDHGCAYIVDKRSDGVIGFDQFYAPYNRTVEEGFTYDFQDPDFTVSDYVMDLKVQKELEASVKMTIDRQKPLDAYTFTLHHGISIDSISDGNGDKLDYERDGDFFIIKGENRTLPEVIKITYHGFNPNLFSNEQAICMPGSYAYYPMPGQRLLVSRYDGGYLAENMVNSSNTQFKITLDYAGTVYCNLPETEPGVYEGAAQTVTFLSGILDCDKVGEVTLIRPSLREKGEWIADDSQYEKISEYLDKCNAVLGTSGRFTLDGKTIFMTGSSVSTNVETVVFDDHIITDGTYLSSMDFGINSIAVEVATAGIPYQDMNHDRVSLIKTFKRKLARYLEESSDERIFNPSGVSPNQEAYALSVSDLMNKAGEVYTDTELFQKIYQYLVQPDPDQSARDFLYGLLNREGGKS